MPKVVTVEYMRLNSRKLKSFCVPKTSIRINAQQRHRLHPDTFEVPTRHRFKQVVAGSLVKIGAEFPENEDEMEADRFWVEVLERDADHAAIFEDTMENGSMGVFLGATTPPARGGGHGGPRYGIMHVVGTRDVARTGRGTSHTPGCRGGARRIRCGPWARASLNYSRGGGGGQQGVARGARRDGC